MPAVPEKDITSPQPAPARVSRPAKELFPPSSIPVVGEGLSQYAKHVISKAANAITLKGFFLWSSEISLCEARAEAFADDHDMRNYPGFIFVFR